MWSHFHFGEHGILKIVEKFPYPMHHKKSELAIYLEKDWSVDPNGMLVVFLCLGVLCAVQNTRVTGPEYQVSPVKNKIIINLAVESLRQSGLNHGEYFTLTLPFSFLQSNLHNTLIPS